ncbi:hypothetical protein FRC03_003195 [Tulasnella sp. 419]|nr:hypothetical protein FRC03_003195 [Tulasnella sp. 419]
MLKNYLADNGLVLSEDNLNVSSGASRGRLHDLQLKLQQKTGQHEKTSGDSSREGRCRVEVDDVKFGNGADDKCSRSSSAEGASGRAVELERKLAEVDEMHRQKMAKLEDDLSSGRQLCKDL